MNIALFTDTYFPQVSGVATSIRTLKEELENKGHKVYIFTTTDPNAKKDDSDDDVFRFSSIPFVSFSERRIAVRGLFQAYQIAKRLKIDIVHTQTEFSMGFIGKFVSKYLKVPCIHTYHTMYEDYLHYVANGRILKPIHVKEGTLAFCHNINGIVAPSNRVLDKLTEYGVKSPIRIIPTGINVEHYQDNQIKNMKEQLNISSETKVLLSVSRLAYEKNIDKLIDLFPKILNNNKNIVLVIVGNGPAKDDLVNQVNDLGIENNVIFTGEIDNSKVNSYYQMADIFVSTSNSESQGLTYIEAMASGIKVVVSSSPYTNELLSDKSLGSVFDRDQEFIEIVSEYLSNPDKYPEKSKLRRQKLHDISSTYFGERILDFYYESINNYDKNSVINRSEKL
ncbi:glycosyltransferase [Lactobacillus sp. S2-2]|uniref:glycosyltransferase family 4 protein n=1 Tax=Lactobacillus sp. S2-2 TaxID=2692917 RepID=UPI001F24EF31|nr:glycosyltransferase [Lactobacillus sp. S2-2]